MDAFTFLERSARSSTPRPLYILHSDDAFLERQVILAIRRLVLGDADDTFALSSYPGDKAVWADILDELQTLPFLSPRRLVIVEEADPFVTRERSRLEKLVTSLEEKPRTGTLVLCVKTWAGNTKLAKLVPDASTIECKTPPANKLPEWAIKWCIQQHGKQLSSGAARLLVDLIGTEMGLIDQELAKLAVYVGAAPKIDTGDVDKLVGRSRMEDTWRIFNLIGEGKAGEAITYLDHLLDQGEEPLKLLGAFSWQMRQLALAGRLAMQGVPLQQAMDRAGVKNWARAGAEKQMRHLGRRRLDRLCDWLLETDAGLKGASQLPPRTLLEQLVVQLARPR